MRQNARILTHYFTIKTFYLQYALLHYGSHSGKNHINQICIKHEIRYNKIKIRLNIYDKFSYLQHHKVEEKM